MEFVLSLGSALLGQSATAGAAGAGAGAAAASVSGSTALSVLQGGLTVVGVLGGLASAGATASQLEDEAAYERLRAGDAQIEGEREAARLNRELLATVSNQTVAYAAGGVDLGSGSVQAARRRASKDAERELAVAENDALRASLAHQHNARTLSRRARSVRRGSVFTALQQGAGLGLDIAQRG